MEPGKAIHMKKCIIYCAAPAGSPMVGPEPGDLLIAADGGLKHLERLGLAPNLVLGDFDSLGYVPPSGIVFPVEKDDTDAMLAVRAGLERGYGEFHLYGCLGGSRFDHSVAALQTLQFLSDHGAVGYLIGENQMATVISGEALHFGPEATGILSAFCMGPDASGVFENGLQYFLDNARLTSGFPLGVSNHFMGRSAEISVKNGSLLVIWDRSGGFPERRSL